MTSLSTHVLDAGTGLPAVGVALTVTAADAGVLEQALTDVDGRARFTADLPVGAFRLAFATGDWFAAAGRDTFYPEVVVAFRTSAAQGHLHVPLLLSAFAYSTYRGS